MFFITQIFIAIFIIFVVAAIVSRGKSRVVAATNALKAQAVSAKVRTEFKSLASRSYMKAYSRFWLVTIVAIIAGLICFQLYAWTQAPNADVTQWVVLVVVTYGIVLATALIATSFLVATAFQHEALRSFLAQQKAQAKLKKATTMLSPRYGELGVSLFSVAAVIGSLATGAGIIAVLFMATQTAIECARSSKCI